MLHPATGILETGRNTQNEKKKKKKKKEKITRNIPPN
jgi:hypothetical protein